MSAVVVDLGNSRWKMALAEDGAIGAVSSGDYQQAPDKLATSFADARRLYVAGVVAEDIARDFVKHLEQVLGTKATVVDNTYRLPNIRNGYRKPEQIGVDRLLAMVAARALKSTPLCVIDAGTAVTMDFVAANGEHLGGFILPGVRMFRDCLLANTAIPRDDEASLHDVLGRDTPTGVALGARYAVAGISEMFLSGSRALFGGHKADVIIGGGDADAFIPLLREDCIKLEHLVLRGLAVVAAGGEI